MSNRKPSAADIWIPLETRFDNRSHPTALLERNHQGPPVIPAHAAGEPAPAAILPRAERRTKSLPIYGGEDDIEVLLRLIREFQDCHLPSRLNLVPGAPQVDEKIWELFRECLTGPPRDYWDSLVPATAAPPTAGDDAGHDLAGFELVIPRFIARFIPVEALDKQKDYMDQVPKQYHMEVSKLASRLEFINRLMILFPGSGGVAPYNARGLKKLVYDKCLDKWRNAFDDTKDDWRADDYPMLELTTFMGRQEKRDKEKRDNDRQRQNRDRKQLPGFQGRGGRGFQQRRFDAGNYYNNYQGNNFVPRPPVPPPPPRQPLRAPQGHNPFAGRNTNPSRPPVPRVSNDSSPQRQGNQGRGGHPPFRRDYNFRPRPPRNYNDAQVAEASYENNMDYNAYDDGSSSYNQDQYYGQDQQQPMDYQGYYDYEDSQQTQDSYYTQDQQQGQDQYQDSSRSHTQDQYWDGSRY